MFASDCAPSRDVARSCVRWGRIDAGLIGEFRTLGAMKVYAAISAYTYNDDHGAHIDHDELRSITGLSRASIYRAIRELRQAGLLAWSAKRYFVRVHAKVVRLSLQRSLKRETSESHARDAHPYTPENYAERYAIPGASATAAPLRLAQARGDQRRGMPSTDAPAPKAPAPKGEHMPDRMKNITASGCCYDAKPVAAKKRSTPPPLSTARDRCAARLTTLLGERIVDTRTLDELVGVYGEAGTLKLIDAAYTARDSLLNDTFPVFNERTVKFFAMFKYKKQSANVEPSFDLAAELEKASRDDDPRIAIRRIIAVHSLSRIDLLGRFPDKELDILFAPNVDSGTRDDGARTDAVRRD